MDRLAAAQKVADELPASSPQLDAALTAKTSTDLAVLEKSAAKSCAANCRALLEQQVSAAAAGVAAARMQLQSSRESAMSELAAAREAVAALPAPASGTALADRLGIDAWIIDLAAAVLGSIGANGLAACLLAFGSHMHLASPATGEIVNPRPWRQAGRKVSGRDRVRASRCHRAGSKPTPPRREVRRDLPAAGPAC